MFAEDSRIPSRDGVGAPGARRQGKTHRVSLSDMALVFGGYAGQQQLVFGPAVVVLLFEKPDMGKERRRCPRIEQCTGTRWAK
jgi:hypothetical protein